MAISKNGIHLCDTCIEDPGCRYDTKSPVSNCHDYAPTFDACVVDELDQMRRKLEPVHSEHEGYSLLLNGMNKFLRNWVHRVPRRQPQPQDDGLDPLVQLAATAQRVAEDCGLIHRKSTPDNKESSDE